MEKVLSFLTDLRSNNNKEWFDANKVRFLEAQSIFNNFIGELLVGIGEFDPSVRNLQLKDCVYRIYRDLRFSKDKTPYKTHMGGFIAPGGKCGGRAGYYFHIEPKEADYLGGHILSAGVYMPTPKALKSIREEIMLNGDQFHKSVIGTEGFDMEMGRKLKKVPSGFPADSPFAQYFKYQDFFLSRSFDDKFLADKNLLRNTLNEFKKTVTFNTILNRAIDYAD